MAFVIGLVATAIYNPLSAAMREWSKRLEAEIFGDRQSGLPEALTGFWVRQRSVDGQSIVYAASSQEQGVRLDKVSVFTFDPAGTARWNASRPSARRWSRGTGGSTRPVVYVSGAPPRDYDTYLVKTNLTAAQVRESFSTPETVPFWDLPAYIEIAERSGLVAAGYKLQYHLLIARPFLLSAMVLLACSVSLRFFRFGGVARMVLSGIAAGLSALCSVQGD